MCGISGILDADRSIGRVVTQSMLDSISHRGPDDCGLWQSKCGTVTLGSQRLAILDRSLSGHMPMVSEDKSCVIVFNGEIYNYREIAAELESRGYRFRSTGDTEVLLAAYREWGESCLDRLNGMFAFAIWDESRKELFAARDRFGEKPFYYYLAAGGRQLLFASEIKALFCSGQVQPEANERAVYRFLVYGDIDASEETMFRDVMALPAAHALRFKPGTGHCKVWQYWDLEPGNDGPVESDKACADRFLELFSDSVRLRLRADVPVGSSLSGGLDSSSIVCAIAREGHDHQSTFTARFPGYRQLDEGRYVEAVTNYTGLPNYEVAPDPDRIPAEAERLAWHQDHPFSTSSVYAQWSLMRLVSEHGVTVLLDGQGGDEILAGYDHYLGALLLQLLRSGHWMRCSEELRSYLRNRGWQLLPNVLAMLLPHGVRGYVLRRMRSVGVRDEFLRQWRNKRLHAEHKFADPLRQELYDTVKLGLPKLLRFADRNSMAFSREVRLPFLDYRLVEWLFTLPSGQLIRQGERKVVLRRALDDLLPEMVRNRRDKLGFGPPENAWLRGPLRGWASSILMSDRLAQREWSDGAEVRRLYTAFADGHKSNGRIWRWISLELWAQMFLDGQWRSMAPVAHKPEAYQVSPPAQGRGNNSHHSIGPPVEMQKELS